MLRRSVTALSGGMVPFHDWNVRDNLQQRYEGWRILDNIKMTKWEACVEDFNGLGRHLDPIIDDPRLSHKQRVARLYHWALKELMSTGTWGNTDKFNLGLKTIRNRFERYRYVTDPAMCDMMIRETQKYLREVCNSPTRLGYDYRSPDQPLYAGIFTTFPDYPQNYDHWTDPQVFIYDELKLHRWFSHHPSQTAPREMAERFGELHSASLSGKRFWRPLIFWGLNFYCAVWILASLGFFWNPAEDPPRDWHHFSGDHHDLCDRATAEKGERAHRVKDATSYIDYDWDWVMGKVGNRSSSGNFEAFQRSRLERNESEQWSNY